MKRRLVALAATLGMSAMVLTACGSLTPQSGAAESGAPVEPAAEGTVTLEFAQWWEPELPDGSFRALMDEFEAANPGIKVELLSGPYASTKEQLVAGAAAGTMPDVVGLDGAWVSDFVKQGAITDLTALMGEAGYDDAQLASQIKVADATYMIPVVNFVYPMFVNRDLLDKAGVAGVPSTRTEFADAAKKVSEAVPDASGWVMPLSLEAPNGIQNDVMAWVWASGGSMLTPDGKPNVNNEDVKSAVEFIKGLWDNKVIANGAFTMKEQDKVEDFTNGRVGMMIDSLAHINLIREASPDLKFEIAAIPAKDGYSGERGMPYASWGIGVSNSSEHKVEAWKLVEFLMSKDVNARLSDSAHAFPGHVDAEPAFVKDDEFFKAAFDIWNAGRPANEFTGLPVAEKLMRSFDEEFQRYLSGDITVDEMLTTVQTTWEGEF
ncbi:sugar ABC transporter substrate-binding protein [Schaalia sp. Marseille-Q2122]|uniref:ABC transporter substrate-binding protein n=1 Tax=Schaalia sp. Marseille-Q2122 TaxID=2736604 RepID=UPI00158D4C7B|nr:sugar ABC transporter substrate-binding protein [Schaalia sp. Marseille-Q2122]